MGKQRGSPRHQQRNAVSDQQPLVIVMKTAGREGQHCGDENESAQDGGNPAEYY